jgi:hypothetical protein
MEAGSKPRAGAGGRNERIAPDFRRLRRAFQKQELSALYSKHF